MARPRRRPADEDAERIVRRWRRCRWFGIPSSETEVPAPLVAFRAVVRRLDGRVDLTAEERLGIAVAYLDRTGLREDFERFDAHLESCRDGYTVSV